MNEKDFEDIICKWPELIEEGLILKGRQVSCYGRRIDVLFEDKFQRQLIIELKWGPIKDEHIGQILSYEGMLLSADDPSIRVMLIGNKVPWNIQRSLDHHGIAWKEITLTQLRDFLNNKHDEEFMHLFNEKNSLSSQKGIQGNRRSSIHVSTSSKEEKMPAILSLVEEKWIQQAFDYFSKEKQVLYFCTSSIQIKPAESLNNIKHVYFKLTGTTCISLQATFVGFTEDNPSKFRLPGRENETARYYYGFGRPIWLNDRIDLGELRRFKSEKSLRNDVPGACIIIDPLGGY